MTRYGEEFIMDATLMDTIATYMDGELAPCAPEDFLIRYCELDDNFEDLIWSEFSITL